MSFSQSTSEYAPNVFVYLADLLGEEQTLCESQSVFGQVVSKAAQRKVLHD